MSFKWSAEMANEKIIFTLWHEKLVFPFQIVPHII
jgi:hypothetical protein